MYQSQLHAMTNGAGRSSQAHTISIAVPSGGTFLDLANFRQVVHADAVLVADVVQELGRVQPVRPSLVLPLARGETTSTLLEKAVKYHPEFTALQKQLQLLPAVDLQQGLAMLRSLGLAAVQVAAQEHSLLQRFQKELLLPLLKRNNGGIGHVEVGYFNSGGGGTGGPAGRTLAELAAEGFLQRTRATVTLTGVQVGAVTFLGLGDDDRMFRNSGVTLAEQIAFTLDPHRPARESRALVFAELPTVDTTGREIGADRETRSLLALTLAGALYSRKVQEQILRGRPNRSLLHPYGSLMVVKASWHELLAPQAVGAAAAQHYTKEVTTLFQQESPTAQAAQTTIEAVRVDLRPLPTNHPLKTAEDLISMAKQSPGVKPPLVDEEVCASREMTGEVRVRIGGNEMPLDQFLSRVTDVTSLDRYTSRYAQLREGVRLAEVALTAAQNREAKLQRTVGPLKQELLRTSEGLFRASSYDRIEATFLGFGVKVRRFRRAYQHYHAAQAEYLSARTQAKALESGLTRLRRSLSAVEELHRRFSNTLETLAGTQGELACEFQPLTAVYGDMMRMLNGGDVGQLRTYLSTTARAMTLDGLAKVVGSAPTAAGVSGRFLTQPRYEGPPWGGEEPTRAPFLSFIVLPPIDDALCEQIQQAATNQGLTQSVVAADTLAGGAAVLRLDLFEVADLSEIFTPAYLLGLKEALTVEPDLYPLTDRARALASALLASQDRLHTNGAQFGKETSWSATVHEK